MGAMQNNPTNKPAKNSTDRAKSASWLEALIDEKPSTQADWKQVNATAITAVIAAASALGDMVGFGTSSDGSVYRVLYFRSNDRTPVSAHTPEDMDIKLWKLAAALEKLAQTT